MSWGGTRFGLALILLLLTVGAAGAEQVRLTFLHVNDIYEYAPVDGKGGLAELATRLDEERARMPHPIFTFGGDLLSPSLASGVTKGAHLIAMFNALGTQAAVPGNHEFDFGSANFSQRIAESNFPWIASNVSGVDGLRPTQMLEVGGVKVGFLGILTGHTKFLSAPDGGVAFANEQASAEAAVAALRAQGAEVVVALTHLDLDEDRRLALTVKGIDLILGGHDHDPIAIQEGGALILKAGHDAQWLGEVELLVDRPDAGRTGQTTVQPLAWHMLRVEGAAPNAKLAALATATDSLLGDALDRPLATTRTALDSRSAVVRGGEAAIGNLIADALRRHFHADLALVNGGGIRGQRQYAIDSVLTRRDVLAELPFGNAVVELDLSGAEVLAVLEHGLSAVEAKAGRFPQVSGLRVVFDPTRPVGHRVVSVVVAGRPLEPKRRYRLATIDYLAAGGDGYAMLKTAKVMVDASGGPLLANVVMDHLVEAGPVAPEVEGRMTPLR